ncbi:ATP-binding protein [Bradyrhizobium oligotrophicum]|uniref:ATP-binding protein n=1 Tax=Bradyrhizobium oligotrophicum TaxID=44255 RepID=UPI003EB7F582
MTDAALQFSDDEKLGRVASVDTSRVALTVTNSVLLTRIGIGQLIAIRGSTEREYLIAITERVTRSIQNELPDLSADDDSALLVSVPTDLVHAILIGTFRTVEGAKSNTFKRGADSFPQIDREAYVVSGSNLQRFMGILGAGFTPDERLKLGSFVADRSADAIASGDKFFQRHAAILGSTGSGKSWAVALILERAAKLKYPNIIVFDMHGEYAPLADEANGGFAQRFRIAGPGDLDNPDSNVLFLPYWLLNRDEMLSMILDRSDQNAPNQASRFTLHVRNLKGATLDLEKREAVKKTFTVDSPIPYDVRELVKRLDSDNTTKGVGSKGAPVKGEWEDKLTRFLSRLEAKLDDRRYGFMFSPPRSSMSYDWLAGQVLRLLGSDGGSGIKVIDFSEVPADVLPVVTGTLSRLLYDVQFWMSPKSRTPITLLCDEAHLYLPVRDDADAVQRQALGSFERIAKEGRKYGFSLLVVSQRPSDVSRTILSQCNNFLALRLTNETDQGVIKRLMPDSLAGLTSILPLLDTGEALLLGDAVLLPTRIKLDIPKIRPDSATRDFWTEWGNVQPEDAAIKAAVERLRSQARS